MFVLLLLALTLVSAVQATVWDFAELGGIPFLDDVVTQWHNGILMNKTLNSLKRGDTFVLPNTTFVLMGGILVTEELHQVVFQLDGTIKYSQDRDAWPRNSGGSVLECLSFSYLEDVVFTSSGGADNRGTFDGQGQVWWGAIQFLKHQEDRPRLFHIAKSHNIIFEKILLKDSPYWTFWAENCDVMEIRNAEIDVRWDNRDKHDYLDLQAFNTDGFDVTGQYVHIHDVTVWNDDDCVCVKDGSKHMLFERITASGLGLVVGSIGSSVVHNITFRDSVMHKTVKGIYMKTRWSDEPPPGEDVASITNVLYENITMYEPQQFAIWIGPAQQTGQPCSLLWPHLHAECKMSGYQIWRNITLRNIYIHHAAQSPGVILGNSTYPMQGITLENVVFYDTKKNSKPFDQDYYCPKGGVISSQGLGETSPMPPCMQNKSD
jgi:hypothetical protein